MMNLRIIGVFLFFTCARASSLSSGPMDFMAGAKKENILHLKDPRAEIKDFSEAFKDVANSEEKIKTTFGILNRPNDSRFKLDLMLILSQMEIMGNESQSFENKEKAWAVLQPLLEKYDKDFTYPADYDVLSGEFIEIILDHWIDRYTQEKVVNKSSSKVEEDESEMTEGYELHYTTEDDDESSPEGYEIGHSEDEAETSTEYQLVGTTEDGEAVLQSTTEYYIPEVDEPEELDLLAEEGEDSRVVVVNANYSTSRREQKSIFFGEQSFRKFIFSFITLVEEMRISHNMSVTVISRIRLILENYFRDPEGFSTKVIREAVERMITNTLCTVCDVRLHFLHPTPSPKYLSKNDENFSIVDLTDEAVLKSVPDLMGKELRELLLHHRSGDVFLEKEPVRAGSIRGIPGVHFPDYDEIPITSFSCVDKKYVPGFYADLETGCQVFHVCWPHRRESFLCPIGTLFNQAILSCDYWYSTNCSLSPLYYDVNNWIHESTTTTTSTPRPPTYKSTPKLHTKTTTTPHSEPPATPSPSLADVDWARVLSILPIRSKVTVYPQSSKTSHAKDDIFGKTEQGKALKKAIATKIIGKVLHAAETLAKTAVRTLPIKYATKKPGQVHSTVKPQLIKSTVKPQLIKVHSTAKPQQIKVHTTVKPGKIHVKQPPMIIERFVVKPRKFEVLKPILAGKLVTSPKVGKQQKVKLVKEHIPDVLLGAMEMAGTVLQKDILPLTRMALVESSLKHSKSKKH